MVKGEVSGEMVKSGGERKFISCAILKGVIPREQIKRPTDHQACLSIIVLTQAF